MRSPTLGLLANLFLATSGLSTATHADSLVVQLTSGSFRGVSSSSPGNTEKWLGIPFAEPPVGSLRFKAPVPIIVAPRSVQNASAFGNACPQAASSELGAPIGEDCLNLNVGILRRNIVTL